MKKTYTKPEIRRVRLEDKPVVAMAACNQFIGGEGAGRVLGDNVVDQQGNVLALFDPSL